MTLNVLLISKLRQQLILERELVQIWRGLESDIDLAQFWSGLDLDLGRLSLSAIWEMQVIMSISENRGVQRCIASHS